MESGYSGSNSLKSQDGDDISIRNKSSSDHLSYINNEIQKENNIAIIVSLDAVIEVIV